MPEYPPIPRFHLPLIEPGVQITRTRLSDKESCVRSREVARATLKPNQPETTHVRNREAGPTRPLRLGLPTQPLPEPKEIEAQIAGMIAEHRVRLLELGAAGRLLIAGEIDEVLPLDDADLLDKAKPVTPDGKIRLDPGKLEARHDGQVKAVLAQSKFGLVVLGGAHDLSDSVRRLGGSRCEYIRVTTKRVREFAE